MVPIVRVIYKPFPLKTGRQQPFDPSSLIQSQAIRFHGDKCNVHVVSQFVRGIPQRRWEGHIQSCGTTKCLNKFKLYLRYHFNCGNLRKQKRKCFGSTTVCNQCILLCSSCTVRPSSVVQLQLWQPATGSRIPNNSIVKCNIHRPQTASLSSRRAGDA